MINENETNNQTSEVASYSSGLHAIANQQKQLSRPSEYALPNPFSMGERPKNIDSDDVPTRDVNRRVGGDEKFGVKYEKKKYFDVCNNCGKQGHTFKQCKNPITSFGVIVFRINPLQQREYLMIRRKDTLGYIDFMRGKYSASNQKYIFNMIEQMTIQEKYKLKKYTFDELWHDLWIEEHSLLSTEDVIQPSDQTLPVGDHTERRSQPCAHGVGTEETRPDRRVIEDALTEDLDDMDVVSLAERSDDPSPRQAELARAQLLQASPSNSHCELPVATFGGVLADRRSAHSGLRPPNTTNVSGDKVTLNPLWSEKLRFSSGFPVASPTGDVLRISTHILKDDVGVLQNMMKPLLSEETIIDTSTIYQTYKQEEMNSRDKFIYLTTKYIKDIPHQSNLLPYLQKMSCKHDQDHETPVPDWSSITNFKDNFVTGEIWESREDKGAISILHYLIELSIQNSTNEEQDPIQDLNEEPPLHGIRDERSNIWTEPEWGFPKGRRNFQEKDYDCALREMTEETGYPLHLMKNMKNILPFDEIFLGSNYKSYKHRYYLMYMNYEDSLITDRYDRSEVSMMRWKTYEECLLSIRPYNLEKKRLIKNIEITLSNYFHTATGLPKTYSHR